MRLIPVSASATFFLLAACGNPPGTTTIRDDSGGQATLATGPAATPPPNLPAYAPLYPGARVESSMSGTSSDQDGARQGGMVAFRTADPPERVANFYRARLAGANLANRSDANMNGTLMLAGTDPADADRGVQVSIAPDDGGSFVTLVFSASGG